MVWLWYPRRGSSRRALEASPPSRALQPSTKQHTLDKRRRLSYSSVLEDLDNRWGSPVKNLAARRVGEATSPRPERDAGHRTRCRVGTLQEEPV